MHVTRFDDEVLVLETANVAQSKKSMSIVFGASCTVLPIMGPLLLVALDWSSLGVLTSALLIVGLVAFSITLPLMALFLLPYNLSMACDRASRQMLVISQCLKRTSRRAIGFDRVRRVAVEQATGPDRRPGPWTVQIVMRCGARYSVESALDAEAADEARHQECERLAAEIREFLGVDSIEASNSPSYASTAS